MNDGPWAAAPDLPASASSSGRRRLELRADCERCFALCCVAPAFSASADFAIDKAAGQPCPNLRADFRCSIHDRLRPRGFAGCAAFDCHGAGQKVAQVTFGGRDWRADPTLAAPMFAAFAVMRPLHELLWYLNEALALSAVGPFRDELDEAFSATERMTNSPPEELVKLDVDAHRQQANAVLLTGADLRGADLSGADLKTSLFTSQPQLDSAKGNWSTKLPSRLSRPSHWPTAD